MSDATMIALLSPVLSLIGAWVGVVVGNARMDERMKVIERELAMIRPRQHRHSNLLTLICSKVGIRNEGDET